MHPPRILVFATILGVLVGCSPSTAPTPTPVPTVPMCTPEFGGTPVPCTQAEYEQSLRIQERYAEAERVYREFNTRSNQELVDREPVPSDELLDLVSPEYGDFLREVRERNLSDTQFEGQMSVVWVKPSIHDGTRAGSLSLLACVDYSNWRVQDESGSKQVGGLQAERIDLGDGTGSFVIAGINPAEDPSCV